MKRRCLLLLAVVFSLTSCAPTGPVGGNVPGNGRAQGYPPAVEQTPARELAAREAWRQFLAEFRLPDAEPDLEPVLLTPRALPAALAGRIYLNARSVAFDEIEATNAMRGFIERARGVLTGEGAAVTLNPHDLSLVTFTKDGNFYRATYRQANYPYPIASGYGELRIVVGKDGTLLQFGSRLIPVFDLPAKAELTPQAAAAPLVGREFTYTSIAGKPLSYKVSDRADIRVGDLTVYPRLDGRRLTIHLAYPVEVGAGTTWTVYIDAVTGRELGVKPNFAS